MSGEAQPSQVSDLVDYDVRLIVAGTRGYDNYVEFSNTMWQYLERLGDQSVIFISGAAKSGADALIIRFCKEHRLPWVEYPADWDNIDVPGAVIRYRGDKPYNARAGHDRNSAMAKVATHLIVFWDGQSPGTRHMVTDGVRRKLDVTTILVDIR